MKTVKKICCLFGPVLIVLTVPFKIAAIDKDELISMYKNKFVVVMSDGISTGICDDGIPSSGPLTDLLDRAINGKQVFVSVMINGPEAIKTAKSPLGNCAAIERVLPARLREAD